MSKLKDKINKAKQKQKYISKEELKSISVLKKAIKESTVIVTCMGLYNHGKSTLLNTLIDDFEHKTFKTADVRETAQNKKVVKNDITFVDTPGLNAKIHDDKRVMDAVKESDINLFVHNVTTGEFTKKEIEFLERIKKHWKNPKEFIERTIFVLSRIDSSNKDDVAQTQQKMQQQIKDIFGCNSSFVAVSAKNYTKGILENKKILIAKSNIDNLKQLLVSLKDKLKISIVKTKKDRLNKLYNDLIQKLNSKVETNKLEISNLSREKDKIDANFKQDMKNIKQSLSNMYKRLEEV